MDRRAIAPPGSTYSFGPGGLSGIYAVLEAEKAARRWTLPLDRLGEEVDHIAIWDAEEVSDEEWSALLAWVGAGHTAVVGGELANLADRVPLEYDHRPETARSAAADPATVGVRAVSVGTAPRFAPAPGAALVHLLDEGGNPVLLSWAEGAGRIYWSADTEWLSNGRIAREQNLELALNLLLPPAGGTTAFDEYHHGFRTATQWHQILRGPLRAWLVMLACAIALLFWSFGARFGSPRSSPASSPRAAVEYVTSMSHLYRRAQARGIVLQALYRSLGAELGRLTGGARGLGHEEIARRTASRASIKPEIIQSLLDRLRPDRGAVPSEAELIQLARKTEELQRRVRNAGFRNRPDPGKDSGGTA